jgi:ferrous iron transport protein A
MTQNYKVGQVYKIRRLAKAIDKSFRSKLLSMGLMPGTQFQIVSIAPFGDPIQMRVHDFALSLRKKELALLELELLQP